MKILTETEILEIVGKAIKGHIIDDHDQRREFIGDITDVVTKHFGGQRNDVAETIEEEEDYEFFISIRSDDIEPSDGGIYKDYDVDGSL